jgi:FkbM family methyltransferase
MSRFTNLKKYLGFSNAWKFYAQLKKGQFDHFKTPDVAHTFAMRNNPYDYATFEEVLLRKTYDIDFGFTPRFIIDGGANIGLTAAFFASRFPAAQIISLEPDKENYSLLCKNTQAYNNITALNKGVWRRSAHLLVKDIGLGNNGLMVEETPVKTDCSIEATGIAQLMQAYQWTHIDVLKLDVEGSEKEIFSDGYEAWLPKTKVLIVELHDHMKKGCSKAVFTALSHYNFSCKMAGENLVFINENFKLPAN